MKLTALTTVVVLMLFSTAHGQGFPDKIRGYKLYDAKVAVTNSGEQAAEDHKRDALVKLGTPEVSMDGLLSVAIEVGAEITVTGQSGRLDLITFRDFSVNGIPVDIEEYNSAFSFKKSVPITIPRPARGTIGLTGVAKAAYKELIESKQEWTVTGTAFVFGKFKKFGFSFKRVIPIKIDLKIKNPLRAEM